jgi:hypothetical protein
MYRYAQILYEKAHWIFETDETLEQLYQRFAPDIVFVDITNRPEVQEGWDYDGVNFTAPQDEPVTPQPALPTTDELALALTDAQIKLAEQQELIDYLAIAVTDSQLRGV